MSPAFCTPLCRIVAEVEDPKMCEPSVSHRQPAPARARGLMAFHRSEDGSMVVFTLFILAMMLMVGGMSVDVMRFETHRARLQSTLDRAVLAAADLDVCLAPNGDPRAIVEDYVRKNGFEDELVGIDVQQGLGSCTITATASLAVNTIFMQMLQVDQLSTPAASTATEEVDQIEISLVLDISGSMRFSNRLARLRPAANEFVSIVLGSAEPDSMSINLIPYAGQTNPGPVMFDYLQGVRYGAPSILNLATSDPNDRIPFPNNSSCLEMPSTTFGSMALPITGLTQTPMFMNWDIAASVMDWGWCPQNDTPIVYASQSIADLQNRINAIRMHDGTGTHYAMKWAVALLNPASRPAFQNLYSNGVVPEAFRSRPRDYATVDGMKYIVLMTDGQITEQVRPRDGLHELNPFTELQRRPSNQRTNITSASQNVTSFYAMCNQAKAQGIVIFTIAFETTSSARSEMQTCASSAAHFYNVDNSSGIDIGTAFRSIANQINQLRLTQ